MTSRIAPKLAVALGAAFAALVLLLGFSPRADAAVPSKFPASGTVEWPSVVVRSAPTTGARRKMVLYQRRVDGRPQIVLATGKRTVGAVSSSRATLTLRNASNAEAVRLVARAPGADANNYRVTIRDFSTAGRDEFVIADGAATLFSFDYAEGNVAELVNLINTYSVPVNATLLANGTPLQARNAAPMSGGRFGRAGTVWYRLNLPVRPFGQRGWVQADALNVRTTTKRIVIHRRAKYLEVISKGRRVFRAPIATGRPDRPTPLGNFYVAAKYRPPTNAMVSAYALELSAPAGLPDFLKGGVVGIHGTPATHTIGKNASNGCVRVHDRTVLRLRSIVPLGTPVKIVR